MAEIDRERESQVTKEMVEAVLRYNPETGVFRRKDKPNAKVGCLNQKGYLRITVFGERFVAARLAWLLHYGKWPETTVDHINGDPNDDRIANLRLAIPSQQQCNRDMQCNNSSGYKGVSLNKRREAAGLAPWETYITVSRVRKHLGYFSTAKDADAARCKAEAQLHGEFSRTTSEVNMNVMQLAGGLRL